MKRVRWFSSDWVIPLDDLSSKMLTLQYNENTSNGFILSKKTKNNISGKFIEKQIKIDKITDPFGNETESRRIIYQVTKFIITNDSIGLELINPSRSIKKFLSIIQGMVGLGLVLSEVKISPIDWLQSIEQEKKCEVKTIQASGIKANENGVAKVSISGVKDIREEFNNFIDGKKHTVDCVKFTLVLNDTLCKLELYKNSTAKITSPYFDELQKIVRNSLLNVTKKANN